MALRTRETRDWKRVWRDPFVLAGAALIVAWAVAMLPWLDLETRAALSQRFFDPAGVMLAMVACALAARRAGDRQIRIFWWLVASALAAWSVALVPRFPGLLPDSPEFAALWADSSYVAFYLLMFVAARLQPGQDRARVRLETAGFLVLVAAVLLYAVLIPANLDPQVYARRVSSFLLYLVLDVLLVVQFASLARNAARPQWRLIHGLIAATAAGSVLFDALQGLWMAGVVPLLEYGTPIDAAWQAPLLFLLAAARLEREPAAVDARPLPSRTTEPTDSFPGRLILFASILPVVHLFMYGAGLGDPEFRRARGFTALIVMLVLQGLAVIESRRLVRRNQRLKQEQLRAAARMQEAHYWETVGRLVGGIAHEFNNILTAILGHASLLRGQVDDPQARADLEVIEESGKRATSLVSQMLAFGRRRKFEHETLELGLLLTELCAHRFRQLLGKHFELRLEPAPDLPPVRVDRQGLIDALTDIVVNAREAMPDGGTLTMSTCVEAGEEEEGADRAVIVVRDTGEGMSPDVLLRAFEPFFTTKEVGEGTGLGLSSALGTLEQMGGDIDIRSQPGEGTEVRVHIPLA